MFINLLIARLISFIFEMFFCQLFISFSPAGQNFIGRDEKADICIPVKVSIALLNIFCVFEVSLNVDFNV